MTCSTRRLLAVIAVATLAATGCGNDGTDDGDALAGDDGANQVAGVERQPPPDVSSVSLPDASQEGQPFTTVPDDGDVLLVYFGYTSCPDVCPTTMADVSAARADLGDEADRVDLAMVTIDPERDTAETLTVYVQTFVEEGHALRTDDPAALRGAAGAFGADYAVTTGPSGAPEVSHTGSLYAVDDTGHMVLQWPFGTPAEDVAADLDRLLDRADDA
jgi:protein SCO1/2